jgi:hypothetical protein
MECSIKSTHELARQGLTTRLACPRLATGRPSISPSRPVPLSTFAGRLVFSPSRWVGRTWSRNGRPRSITAVRGPGSEIAVLLPVRISLRGHILSMVLVRVVVMAMFAEHGVVVARRHGDKKSRKYTIPSPRSESTKGEWPIGTKVPTKVDECLQRSASAPAESRRRQQGATAVLRINWRSQANYLTSSKRWYWSKKR